MKAPILVLASSSPRRISYLKQLGYPFRQKIPKVDERPRSREKPRAYVRRIALDKARDVARHNPHSWVLAADTAVVVDEAILGKPQDDRDAQKMLRLLSDRWHQVVSSMTLVSDEKAVELATTSVTRVRFRKMRADEIRWYVATGEPSDKAGAYAIQGKGGLFVKRIVGSPSNVVGFPVECFYDLVSKAGLALPQ